MGELPQHDEVDAQNEEIRVGAEAEPMDELLEHNEVNAQTEESENEKQNGRMEEIGNEFYEKKHAILNEETGFLIEI